jgi:hypothetical protein
MLNEFPPARISLVYISFTQGQGIGFKKDCIYPKRKYQLFLRKGDLQSKLRQLIESTRIHYDG